MTIKFEKGQHGPTPVTGNCETREELEIKIVRDVEGGLSQNKTAAQYLVSTATVNNIMKAHRKAEIEQAGDLRKRIMRGAW